MSNSTAKVMTTIRSNVKRIIPQSSSDEDDTPIHLAKRNKPTTNNSDFHSDQHNQPISTKINLSKPPNSIISQLPSKLPSHQQTEESDSEEDLPIANTQPKKRTSKTSNESIDGSSTLTTNTDSTKTNLKTQDESDLSEDEPIMKQKLPSFKKINQTTQPSRRSISNSKKIKREPSSGASSDDDAPIVSKAMPTKKPRLSKSIQPKIEEPDIKPVIATKPRSAAKSKKSKDIKPKVEDLDSVAPIPLADKKPIKAKAKAKPNTTASASTNADSKPNKKGAKVKKEEEQKGTDEEAEDAEYKWWEQTKDDDTKKWDTLQHNGVLFPPEYVPLPKHVKMKYEGKSVDLPPESEEVAGFFGAMLNSDHCQKPTFCQNFFNDFLEVLALHPPRDRTKITSFEKCDFTPIFEYYDAERERKKSLSKEEKTKLKKEKDELEKQFQFCLLDGRQEKVGNFRVEPPSLFRGRGEHPKTGRLKKRIYAEDITINCSKDAPIPIPPAGHQWGSVVHLDKASWLAMWKENINGAFKYVFLAPGSSLKGQSDMKKFEKARQLKLHIERIRADYRQELEDKVMATRQRATAMYLIDVLALRAGNEKGDDEADTVGCCSLRYEHLTLEPPSTVTFDFLGKDSIRFFNTVQVDEAVFKNLRIFKKEPKAIGDMIFDRLTTSSLNKHLSDYMPGLTAKVFRTYNASFTFERELEKNMNELKVPTLAEKIYAYNKANRQVAVLCNHQKSVSKGHETSMEKAYEKIKAMKYQRRRLRYQLISNEGFEKKKHKRFLEDESDIDEDWMEAHEKDLGLKEIEKVTKKFEKDNLALEKAEESPMDESELRLRLKEAEAHEAMIRKERISKKIESVKSKPIDQIILAIEKIDTRIEAAKTACKDKDEGKETSLGTSKMNYIDPRLTYAWCQRNDVPVERMFAKTLREKFTWAASTPGDWKF
ncbi:uncharacterized protein MELLADRAFT_116253 [Melampsora larici-populina 98AG31]|uniref:DNA topoisomerase I n=1 Tax=Melampsora larici-populina (strain 98AG31 / pathotype 3-4-7) TaxID=747676 RepID=F4RJG2_MELLP|nr:uncharacterized protein MELLADRAFT_116253 [Melampsora larici-populina 98AG31]EGG07499.1 hypothetical protein MELLADRAFT_116253 [Melampsora larici-populina 98AG31]